MRKKLSTVLLALLLIVPLSAGAEIVILKSGKQLEVEIIEISDKHITVNLYGEPIVYKQLAEIMKFGEHLPPDLKEEFFERGIELHTTLVKMCISLQPIMIIHPRQCSHPTCPFCPPIELPQWCPKPPNPWGPLKTED